MSRHRDLLLLLACLGAWVFATTRLRGALTTEIVGPMPLDARPSVRPKVVHDVSLISRQGAFRPLGGRSPATADTVSAPPPTPMEVPPVELKGIMGGPPWLAVLSRSGSAGEDRVLRSGDSLDLVAVRAVKADGVTLRFRDSTWTILLREERKP